MSMQIRFPGGVSVAADFKGFEVVTDQPEANGGANSAPSPYDLFLVSLGTCAGFFALRFCQQRELSTEGMTVSLDTERNKETRQLDRVSIVLNLPPGFPEKYHKAIIRATDQCSVKQVLVNPPEIAVTTLSA